MLLGEMIEFGQTAGIFTSPQDKRTQDYVSGRYG
jgi:phosphate transport system ATP-binding protein